MPCLNVPFAFVTQTQLLACLCLSCKSFIAFSALYLLQSDLHRPLCCCSHSISCWAPLNLHSFLSNQIIIILLLLSLYVRRILPPARVHLSTECLKCKYTVSYSTWGISVCSFSLLRKHAAVVLKLTICCYNKIIKPIRFHFEIQFTLHTYSTAAAEFYLVISCQTHGQMLP